MCKLLLSLFTAATLLPTGCAVDELEDSQQSLQGDEIIGPGLVATPDALDFGFAAVGTKRTLPVTLTNTGKASISCNELGADDPAFALSTTWISELAPGKSITLDVTFRPNKPGSVDTVVFAYDGDNRYLEVPVHGVAK